MPLSQQQEHQHSQHQERVPAICPPQGKANGPHRQQQPIQPPSAAELLQNTVQRRDHQQCRPGEGNILPQRYAVYDIIGQQTVNSKHRSQQQHRHDHLVHGHYRITKTGRHKQDLCPMEQGNGRVDIPEQLQPQLYKHFHRHRVPKRHHIVISLLPQKLPQR